MAGVLILADNTAPCPIFSNKLATVAMAGLVRSTGEARRQVQGGGVRVNDAAVTDEKAKLRLADIGPDGVIKLSLGKKKHVLLRPV